MHSLRVNDRVVVGKDLNGKHFSTVFAFTHSSRRARSVFVKISTASNRTIWLSEGHYIYVNNIAVRAGKVAVGDLLHDVDVGLTKVKSVDLVKGNGLYSPQTYHGNVVVNGIVATTYTEAVGEMLSGHALLAPLRMLQRCVFPLGLLDELRCRWALGSYADCR